MKEYKYVISLGSSCTVASGLKNEGLRDASYPFDWIISSVEGMEKAISTHFDGWLNINNLRQSKTLPTAYLDEVYKVKFFHDFIGYRSLKAQLHNVKRKYDRRISRFYNHICSPSLFVRYLFFEEASKEKEWWGNNYHSFLKCLKEYNPDNNLILVTDIQNKFQDMSIPVFYVENDEGKRFCEHPLDNNHKLRNYCINSYNDKMRKKNLERSQMQKNNIVGFVDRLKKKIIRFLTEKFPYQHDKQY